MREVRSAIRALTAQPGFTAVAVLTLALGIGATTAVYTVVHAVLLAPLPYHDPESVVLLHEVSPRFPNPISVSWQNYLDWRDRSTSFDTMAAFRTTQLTLTGAGEAERVTARMVTSTLLPMLRVEPVLGRTLVAGDDEAGAPGVVLLSHSLWTRRFGASPAVTGRAIQLDAQPFTIIGVLPADFELFQPAELYLPIGPWAATLPDDRGWHPGIFPIARLREGVAIGRAQVEMHAISAQLEAEYPLFNRDIRASVRPVHEVLVQNVRPALLMLLGAVALVLLIACANIANLLLTRAVARQKEIAVRSALGGTRARIVRQLVIESVVLACVGGAAGVLVAAWSVSVLEMMVMALPRAGTIAMDGAVLVFALAVSLASGLVFGLAPAIQGTRLDIREALNEESRGSSGSARHQRMRNAFVVTQIALALILLVGAGLMVRSFAALQRVDPGFDPSHLLAVDLPLSPTLYEDDLPRTRIVEQMLDAVRALPDVDGAAVATALPMLPGGALIHFNIAGRPPRGSEDYLLAGYRAVSVGYFETMGIPLRRGRTFAAGDREGAPRVGIINESMARHHFADVDPIGQRFAVGTEPGDDPPWIEVVGVVADVLQSFEAGSSAEYYLPYAQYPNPVLRGMYRNVSLVARAAHGSPTALVPSIRAALQRVDRDQPLVRVRAMEQAMGETIAARRMQTWLLTLFAVVALALAIIGVYGVMSYTVSQRAQEIGVRMALGASRHEVVCMVVWQGARLTAAGIVTGLIGAAVVTRAMQGLLVHAGDSDPVAFVVAPVLLGAAALLASYVPARRAASLAPSIALSR
jgi:putative ABC transport system permease protein